MLRRTAPVVAMGPLSMRLLAEGCGGVEIAEGNGEPLESPEVGKTPGIGLMI